jgi:hypothetical protein
VNLLKDDIEAAAHLRRMISIALRANEVLLSKLTALIEALGDERPLDKDEQELVRTAYKQIAMVVDFENQLYKHGAVRPVGGGETLDLDAARAEIAGRLDRLGAASAARGAA